MAEARSSKSSRQVAELFDRAKTVQIGQPAKIELPGVGMSASGGSSSLDCQIEFSLSESVAISFSKSGASESLATKTIRLPMTRL